MEKKTDRENVVQESPDKEEGFRRNQKRNGNRESSGYYVNKPHLGNRGPSRLRQQFSRGMTFFIVIVACLLFYFALLRLSDISAVLGVVIHVLKPVIYGFAIAYLLNPIVRMTERYLIPFFEKHFPRLKKKEMLGRAIGVCVAVLFLVAVIVALCNMMIPELYRSIRSMVFTVPSQLNDAIGHITEMMSRDSTLGQFFTNMLTEATNFVQNWMRTDLLRQVNVMMSSLTVGVISVLKELFNALIGLIISIYLLFGKETFSRQSKKAVYAIFRPDHANLILHLTSKSNEIFGGFIIGKLIDSAIIGVLCFIGLSILKMPYTLLVSVIVGVTNIIPFFGPYIGAIPSAILIMLSDPKMGIYFIIFILILQQLDGNVIGPKILGNSTGLSAFWVVFSILLGGGLFGFVGMILGVPTFAVIYYIVRMVLNHKLEQKKLPTETSAYDRMSYVDDAGIYVHSEENKASLEEEMKERERSGEDEKTIEEVSLENETKEE